MFSPICDLSSPFISENCTSPGSALVEVCRMVSPSELLIVIVLSSLPRARRFSLLQAPHVILRECLPIIGIFLHKREHQRTLTLAFLMLIFPVVFFLSEQFFKAIDLQL